MIIDITSFLGKWPFWNNKHMDENGYNLIEMMNNFKIDKSIIISSRSIFYDDREGNEIVFNAVKKFPNRLIPSVTINPNNKYLNDQIFYIKKCIKRGAKLIRLYPLYHGYKLSSDNYNLSQIIKYANINHCPICIPIRLLMNWGFPSLKIEEVILFIRSFPKVTFIVDSFNFSEFNPILRLVKDLGNTYITTTCLTIYNGIEKVIIESGSKFLLFGTANPIQNPACNLIKVRKAKIDDFVKNAILKDNIKKILNL